MSTTEYKTKAFQEAVAEVERSRMPSRPRRKNLPDLVLPPTSAHTPPVREARRAVTLDAVRGRGRTTGQR